MLSQFPNKNLSELGELKNLMKIFLVDGDYVFFKFCFSKKGKIFVKSLSGSSLEKRFQKSWTISPNVVKVLAFFTDSLKRVTSFDIIVLLNPAAYC